MSASKVEAAINSGKIVDLNEDDIKAWKAEQEARSSELAALKSSRAHGTDPLGERDVVEQARRSAIKPKEDIKGKEPSRPRLAFTDKSAAHALREVVGPSPFTDVKSFGRNLFIPDSLFYSVIADATDNVMMNTPKFVDAAQGAHPLLFRMYRTQIFYLSTFRAMQAEGVLDTDVENDMMAFLRRLPLNSWPIPGPDVDYITTISSSHSMVKDMSTICPFLPNKPPVYQTNRVMFNHNLAGRVPNMMILAEQTRRMLDVVNTMDTTNASSVRAAARFHPTQASNTNNQYFLGSVFGTIPFNSQAGAGAAGAHPTSPQHSGTFHSNVDGVTRTNLCSPFLLTPPISNERAIRVTYANIDQLSFLLEDAHANAPQSDPTWRQVLLWDNVDLWVYLQAVFALYCRHLSASTTLDIISPSGSTASHVTCTMSNKIRLHERPGRYLSGQASLAPNLSITGHLRYEGVLKSDRLDALTSPINLSWIDNTNGPITRPAGPQENAGMHGRNRLAGPYFYKLPIISRTLPVDPASGYRAIIAAEYHSQTPLRSTIPDE